MLTGTERVRRAILGQEYDRQPIYGWLAANLSKEISEKYGSVSAFEDKYEFDAAHLFGGPHAFNGDLIKKLREENEELTPDILLDKNIFTSPDNAASYDSMKAMFDFHKKRDRFCYIQTPGFFEHFNEIFGIENHLMYTFLYPEELSELYRRQLEWTLRYVEHCIKLGMDMIHVSDDWGAQNDLLFSPVFWREAIYPNMKQIVDLAHSKNTFVSLHSDGCINKLTDGIVELGFDLLHPWQESAKMSYDTYLEKYSDKFAILGGICIQTSLGILPRAELESDIRRVFSKLKGKRWICCTTHFVQNHCTMDDLEFAYDLISDLARE